MNRRSRVFCSCELQVCRECRQVLIILFLSRASKQERKGQEKGRMEGRKDGGKGGHNPRRPVGGAVGLGGTTSAQEQTLPTSRRDCQSACSPDWLAGRPEGIRGSVVVLGRPYKKLLGFFASANKKARRGSRRRSLDAEVDLLNRLRSQWIDRH